jgi:hypothetical protein
MLAVPWNDEEANRRLREALTAIDGLGDRLSPARAEALLDEFERDIAIAFRRRDLAGIKATCEAYQRRFHALSEEE